MFILKLQWGWAWKEIIRTGRNYERGQNCYFWSSLAISKILNSKN